MEHKRPQDLLERTRAFAIDILKFTAAIPPGGEAGILKRQLLRAATSVGANYRAARRARTRREFVSRLSIVEEEADECVYWLDLLQALQPTPPERTRVLRQEADELVAIMVACKKAAVKDHDDARSRSLPESPCSALSCGWVSRVSRNWRPISNQ